MHPNPTDACVLKVQPEYYYPRCTTHKETLPSGATDDAPWRRDDDVCSVVMGQRLGLEGRVAHCTYGCGSTRPSNITIPFFATPSRSKNAQPNWDEYYCGCLGWD